MAIEADLERPLGPMLSDGTTIRDLFDLDERSVSLRVLSDPEIYQLELKKLFARSWVVVGHASELPEPGDFIVRAVGDDKVLIRRTKSGAVAITLNVCAHRGAELCWADKGNAPLLKCRYHGWTFDAEGSMVGMPFEKEVYGDVDKSRLGLTKVATAVRHGVIFANLDPDPVPFDDYLGEEMGWYFDFLYGTTEQEVVGPPIRHVIKANWKAIVDQFAGDAYHFATTHRAMGELGIITAPANDAKGWSLEACWVRMPGAGMACTDALGPLFADGGIERKHPLAGWLMIGLMFPASAISSFPLPDPEHIYPTIGGFVPLGPNLTEMWITQLLPKDASEETRETLDSITLVNNVVLPDDMENWTAMGRGAAGTRSAHGKIRYNTPPRPANNPDFWPGPGSVYSGIHSDDSQWAYWLQWLDLMTAD